MVLLGALALQGCGDSTATPGDTEDGSTSTGSDESGPGPTVTITATDTTTGDPTTDETTDGSSSSSSSGTDTDSSTDTDPDTDTDSGGDPVCGDGTTDRGEDCDDAGESATCNDDCTTAACGDSIVNATAGEDCDDGGESATCNADCTPAMCGDGVVNTTAGEECDGGGDCADDCTLLTNYVSCRELLLANPGSTDGVYPLDPDQDGTTEDVYCDMTTDGGGWTLVSSTRTDPVDDQAMAYSVELQTLNPASTTTGVWDGMRPVVGTNSHVRFTCSQDPDATELDVDLSFYNVVWYDEFTTGTDEQSCFSEDQGLGADDPIPSRRNNLTGDVRPVDDAWNASGYLEGEDSCGATDDFTVDLDDRGMDGNQSDGTDWGEDDGSAKCGESGLADGAWHIWVREADAASCGNGIPEVGEDCDDAGPSDTCTATCTAIVCGDGTVEGAEECDDAGESATCNVDCTAASCGDGVTNTTAGEECDDAGASDTCTDTCTAIVCGDGLVEGPEECDDAGESATCNDDCTTATCGDGVTNATAGEECDDSGPTATCSATCATIECGDGVTDAPEECDDAGESAVCDLDCTTATCGDGTLNTSAGEVCDGELNCAADCASNTSAASCLAILTDDPSALDGVYFIDPAGDGTEYTVYCDMTTDGGGWTLVSSTLDPVDDAAMAYTPELQTINPSSNTTGVWDGMRPLVTTSSDVRFTCMQDPTAAAFDVDLSFYDVVWYDEFTTGTDADSCFSENEGTGQDAPPARRDNIAMVELPAGDAWNSGYLEGEDTCSTTDDFTIDFDDRGMDSDQSDGTDWGEDDGTSKCGTSGVPQGAWHIWVRETGN